MATVSTPRQPFAELGASRLQSLSSAKNRQNALTELLSSESKGKASAMNSKINLSSSSKRSYSLSVYEDDYEDTENVDPVTSPSAKRTKNFEGQPTTKAEGLFSPDRCSNPVSPLKQRSTPTFMAPPSSPSSAPAGRLLKPKRVSLLSKMRSSLSPYKRVDPPSFCSNKTRSAGLSFSIDDAISGTLAKATPLNTKSQNVPLLEEAVPKGWLFDIHEDTPDEEAAIIMEHSTCTLDLSSDDEAGPSRAKDGRGKENIPPPDDTLASPITEIVPAKLRRSIHIDAMADDGEERAPLGALPAEDFYAQGLDKDSVQVITDFSTTETPSTPVIDDFDDATVDKENAPDALDAPPSPTRYVSSPDVSLVNSKPDFIIAEDLVAVDA